MNEAIDCLFCQIVAGAIAADVVYRDEQVLAFRDITPKAPTHILIVPTLHASDAAELAKLSPVSLIAMFLAADRIAAQENLDGYRTVFNTGAAAGQSVFHAHLHLFGGRPFAWPPG